MANTKEQQLAIDIDNTNIIVSAGAGSGKTAVLTQRVIRKILSGVRVNQLLVLTFTNEAAREMKGRIRNALIKNNLLDEIILLDSAYITTFDSFAFSLVKKYAYELNVSNNLKIIDSNIITIEKYKIIDKIFDSLYGDDKFNNLIDHFCSKDDQELKEEIIKLSNSLDLLLDKDEYLLNYSKNFFNDKFNNLMVKKYEELIKRKIVELLYIYEELSSYLTDSLINKIDIYLKPLKDGKCYDDYLVFNTQSNIRFTNVCEEGLELKEEFKNKIDEIKYLLRYKSSECLIESITKSYDDIEVIIKIIRMLDKEINNYKHKYDIYEFNDIAHMAIEIVSNNEDIRKEVSNSFNEIMIDEYQDTSNIQEEFIKLISKNNVYMVGDIKQSIYRFRNANPYIFQEKYNKYDKKDGGIKIDLLKNFRSRSETLDNINEIFNLIMDDEIGNANYLVSHNMVYGNTNYDLEDTLANNKLEIYNYLDTDNLDYSKEEKELFIISEDIQNKIKNKYQVFDKNTNRLRNIKYDDICIITDQNKYLTKYKKILEYKQIPSVIYMDLILTNDRIIMIIKNLISLVYHVKNKIYDDEFRYLFTSVSRSFLFRYSDNYIYNINMNKNYFDTDIYKLAKEIDTNNSIVKIINDIITTFSVYEKLTTLNEIEENIIKISNLIDIANDYNDLGYGLEEFINYLDMALDKELQIKYNINTETSNAVKIMNIHKSKGLEFSLCYFTGMHNKFSIRDLYDKILYSSNEGLILSYKNNQDKTDRNICYDIYKDNYIKEEVSEKIRLFYVALTRCREKMIIVTSLSDDDMGYSNIVPISRRIKYRSFLDILNSLSIIRKYVVFKEAEYTHEYERLTLKEIENSICDIKMENRELKLNYEEIENKHFSKSSNILYPYETLKLMKYGTKVHEELEFASFKDISDYRVENLFKHFDKNYINIYREYEFKYKIDNVNYHGIIDLMIEYDKYINIIDYKLKDISDDNYIKQLNGYKEYIKKISNKDVYIYLYSIVDNEIKKL